MADEEGWDDGSENPDEEGQEQEPRRVRPLFRFRRGRNDKEETGPAPEEVAEEVSEVTDDERDHQSRVRPVRVVRFVPNEDAPFVEAEVIEEEEGEEAPFTLTEEVVEEQPPYEDTGAVEGDEFLFTEAEVADVLEDEPPFAMAEVVEGVEEEPNFTEAETPFESTETPEPEMMFAEVEEERSFATAEEGDGVPEVPFAVIEEVEREEIESEGVSTEEEAETSDDLQFRQEETPVKFERNGLGTVQGPTGTTDPHQGGGAPATPPMASEPPTEERPHYHKYLKPDDDLVSRPQARGRPTGFDRDLESEAGEIEFGIDLIDPHERKKKPPKKPGDLAQQPKKGTIGGHDSDAEVGTRELGVDIGVDYTKRRKRRL